MMSPASVGHFDLDREGPGPVIGGSADIGDGALHDVAVDQSDRCDQALVDHAEVALGNLSDDADRIQVQNHGHFVADAQIVAHLDVAAVDDAAERCADDDTLGLDLRQAESAARAESSAACASASCVAARCPCAFNRCRREYSISRCASTGAGLGQQGFAVIDRQPDDRIAGFDHRTALGQNLLDQAGGFRPRHNLAVRRASDRSK